MEKSLYTSTRDHSWTHGTGVDKSVYVLIYCTLWWLD